MAEAQTLSADGLLGYELVHRERSVGDARRVSAVAVVVAEGTSAVVAAEGVVAFVAAEGAAAVVAALRVVVAHETAGGEGARDDFEVFFNFFFFKRDNVL